MKKLMDNKVKFFSILALLLILTMCSIHILHTISLFNSVEDGIRIVGSIILVEINILFILFGIKVLKNNNTKKKGFIIFIITLILYSSLIVFISCNVKNIYNKLHNISSSSTVYSSSVVTLNTNNINSIESLDKITIGMINEDNNIEGFEIPNQIIKDEKLNWEIKYYENYPALIQALLDEEVKYIFLPTNYSVRFSSTEGLEDIGNITKIIYSKSLEKEDVDDSTTQKSLKEPITILLMGVDSELEGIKNSSFNGDALMLITFNPDTLNTTILSIPRDTYMPITCMNNRSNKITDAGWYGEECIMSSIENFMEVDIDYYVKINFKGIVQLVDALGGVDMNVEYSFCEQNSNREWEENTVVVDSGLQHLNGEQALAYARHRHISDESINYCDASYNQHGNYWNDFTRGKHQQDVIKALLGKLGSINSFSTIEDLLSTISNNIQTNMSTSTILSFYNLGKNILSKSGDSSTVFNMQRLYLKGDDSYMYSYNNFINNKLNRRLLYYYVPYNGSLKDIKNAMKVNLGLIEEEMIKTFSFSINNEYKEVVIGKGYYNEAAIALLPNFIGKNIDVAQSYAEKHGISIKVNYIEGNEKDTIGTIKSQNIPASLDINFIGNKTLIIEAIGSIKIVEPEIPEEPKDPIVDPVDTPDDNPTELPETPIADSSNSDTTNDNLT